MQNRIDRKIEIPKSAIQNGYHKSQKFSFKLFWISLLALTAYSAFSLDTSGFNSNQAFEQFWIVIKKFIQIDQNLLREISWVDLYLSFVITFKMALLGSFLGLVIALPLAILAARNLAPDFIAKPFRFLLMCLRTVPSLIWALIFVAALGIGSIAGIFALTFYSVGYLGKLIYESLEDLDHKSFEALKVLGASRFQAFYMSLLPKMRPVIVTHFIFMLEYNIRAASLLGLVGAGGIGQDLMYFLEWRQFPQALIILMIMVVIIYFADLISEKLRAHLIKDRGQ